MLANILIVDDDDSRSATITPADRNGTRFGGLLRSDDWQRSVEKHSREAHVALMDFNMPAMDGLKASRLILSKCPDASILMVTVFWSAQLCDEAQKAGLKGVCSKSESERIIEGIQTLLRGETFFPVHIH